MKRSIFAVIIGYLIFAVSAVALFQLSGREPHTSHETSFMALSTLYGAFFAALAGYTAARLAGRNALRHAQFVALIIALLATLSLVTQYGKKAIWSELATLLLMAPCAVLGGLLRHRQLAAAENHATR